MIKVGVLGGETQMAGELIRLLVHHPEVDLTSIISPSLYGKQVNRFHRGIIGDTDIRFSKDLEPDKLDVLFVTIPWDFDLNNLSDDLRVVFVGKASESKSLDRFQDLNMVTGVSEVFRKPLVRGARIAMVPSPLLAVSLISLFPLALHLLLNDTLKIRIRVPSVFYNPDLNNEIERDLIEILGAFQLSFEKLDYISVKPSDLLRSITVEIEMSCGISTEEIERVYENTYDDHNFAFPVKFDPAPTEVAGTQKCLIFISKPSENILRIKSVADSYMRGGAGDAIHAMNLLFGLYEKTGLSFPASMAFKPNEVKPESI